MNAYEYHEVHVLQNQKEVLCACVVGACPVAPRTVAPGSLNYCWAINLHQQSLQGSRMSAGGCMAESRTCWPLGREDAESLAISPSVSGAS